jgi:hypothetical protein
MSYAGTQTALRSYAHRVYGEDVEIDTAVVPVMKAGVGYWRVYIRYPRGRWFPIEVRANKIAGRDSRQQAARRRVRRSSKRSRRRR